MYFAPIITLFFYLARDNKKKQILAYLMTMVMYGVSNVSGYIVSATIGQVITSFLISNSGIALSAICVLVFYDGTQT